MNTLQPLVHELNTLIQAGHTLEAMERFYADEVSIQENDDPPRAGKAVCLAHEKQMLAQVSDLKATLHRQAINEASGIVFSEWTFESTTQVGTRYVLIEVSVQEWQNERIQSERFYYRKVHHGL